MKVKEKPHWVRAIMGIVMLAFSIYPKHDTILETELVFKTLVVSAPIKKLGGRGNTFDFKIYASGFACNFGIKRYGGMGGKWDELVSITTNDTLIVQINKSWAEGLNNEDVIVPVYSLARNGRLVFSVDDYNRNDKFYSNRLSIILAIVGALLFLRGATMISSKMGYLLALVSFVIILSLKLLDKW